MVLGKDDPNRMYYFAPYHVLLRIFYDAKVVAARMSDVGGADHRTFVEFEHKVMLIMSAYVAHPFATTPGDAASSLFTFLRHLGMLPTNTPPNATYMTVVAQRKIRCQFMNFKGIHLLHDTDLQQHLPQSGSGPLEVYGQNSQRLRIRHILGRRRRQEYIPAVEWYGAGRTQPVRGRRGNRCTHIHLGRRRRRGAGREGRWGRRT